MRVTIRNRIGLAIALAAFLLLTPLSGSVAIGSGPAAYDEAAPNLDPVEHRVLEAHRAELMDVRGVSLVYVAADRFIVVRVRKLTPEIDQQIPKLLEGCPVRVVSVEDVVKRHLHELRQIAGEDQLYSCGVESLPDGQLAIVVRVRRPDWQQPLKVPTNIEGIPLRVVVAQDSLSD
jgi:hypothetical protein